LGKPVYTLVVVSGLISGIEFICQSPVAVYPVKFSVEISKFVKQIFVLILTGALTAVEPFIIG